MVDRSSTDQETEATVTPESVISEMISAADIPTAYSRQSLHREQEQ
jgi:hypothetical protein